MSSSLGGGGLTVEQLRALPLDVNVVSGGGGGALAPSDALTDDQLRAAPVPVSGTVAVSNLPATQPVSGTVAVSNHPLSQAVTGVFFQATQPVSIAATVPVSGPATDVQLRATPLPVSGTVTATGPVTDTQLRANPVPVSGTFWPGTQPVSGSVSVSNFPATQAVSGAFFQATQPVSIAASVAVTGPVTDAQIRASPLPVSGPTTDAQQRAFSATLAVSTLSSANAGVTLTLPAAGASLFHYITSLEITRLNPTTGAIAAAATTLAVTSTNLNGLAWSSGNLLAAGATDRVYALVHPVPIRSQVANTATTIVAPAGGAGALYRLQATYYTGP